MQANRLVTLFAALIALNDGVTPDSCSSEEYLNMCWFSDRPQPQVEGVYRVNSFAWDGYMLYGYFSVGTEGESSTGRQRYIQVVGEFYILHFNLATSQTWLITTGLSFREQEPYKRFAVTKR